MSGSNLNNRHHLGIRVLYNPILPGNVQYLSLVLVVKALGQHDNQLPTDDWST